MVMPFALDAAGNLAVADTINNTIYSVEKGNGRMTLLSATSAGWRYPAARRSVSQS